MLGITILHHTFRSVAVCYGVFVKCTRNKSIVHNEHQDQLASYWFIIGCQCCDITASAPVTRPQPPNSLSGAQLSADHASQPPHKQY